MGRFSCVFFDSPYRDVARLLMDRFQDVAKNQPHVFLLPLFVALHGKKAKRESKHGIMVQPNSDSLRVQVVGSQLLHDPGTRHRRDGVLHLCHVASSEHPECRVQTRAAVPSLRGLGGTKDSLYPLKTRRTRTRASTTMSNTNKNRPRRVTLRIMLISPADAMKALERLPTPPVSPASHLQC